MSFLRESWNVAFKCRNLLLKFTYDSGFQRTRLTTRFFHATENHHAATDHYSALKVPRGATQAQIKSAYYKLCMEHHPDTSLGCPTKAREEFTKISEAYAVLGQVESRRKYDKEHLQQYPKFRQTTFTRENQFTHSFQSGHNTSTKGPQFNFDEFYRAHYRNIKQWESERKRTQFGIPRTDTRSGHGVQDFSQEAFITLCVILTLFTVTGVLIVRYGRDV